MAGRHDRLFSGPVTIADVESAHEIKDACSRVVSDKPRQRLKPEI